MKVAWLVGQSAVTMADPKADHLAVLLAALLAALRVDAMAEP